MYPCCAYDPGLFLFAGGEDPPAPISARQSLTVALATLIAAMVAGAMLTGL